MVAEMRLQALREAEERKLANKKPRTKRPQARVEEVPVKERARQKEAARDSSPQEARKAQEHLSVGAEKINMLHGSSRYLKQK